MFFKWLVLGKGGVDDVGREPANSSYNALSVAMAHWNVERRVFAVELLFQKQLKINKDIFTWKNTRFLCSTLYNNLHIN